MVNEAIIMPAIAPDNDKLFFFKPCWAIQIGIKIVTVRKWRIYKYLLRFRTIDEKTAWVLSCNVKKITKMSAFYDFVWLVEKTALLFLLISGLQIVLNR